jgi:tight adherence protein C
MGFLSITDIVIMAIGIISLVIWLIVLFCSAKYGEIFENLDDKEFPLKDLYCMGYFILVKFNYDFKSKKDRKLRKELEVLYSEKYADYYLRVVHSQQIAFFMLIFVIAFIFYGLSGEIVGLVIVLAFSALAYYYFGSEVTRKIQKRSDELLNEFSEVVSKLALLTNAGMILREAWEEIAYSEEGTIYEEMVIAVNDMNNGVSEVEAIRRFGSRCMIPEIKKFTTTIIQGLTKGNKELVLMLQKQSSEVWNLKRQLVKRKGAQAESKLMVPMLIMLIGVLVMIMIPIFTNLGV